MLEERSPQRWEQFLEGHPSSERERPPSPVIARWSRSLGFKVDPRGPTRVDHIEARRGLALRRERAAETWHLLRPLFERVAARLAEQDYVSLLTDPEGVILWEAGGGRFAPDAREARLMEGAHWGEPVRGTNAIGTALHEERPVAVVGCAHFERTNHQLVCYGHPIRDPDGHIAGLLDVTSALARADDRVRLAVAAAVDGMELLLQHHAWSRARGGLEPYRMLLRHHRGPALLVSAQGAVLDGNEAAQALLCGPDGLPAGLERATIEAAARGTAVSPVVLGQQAYRLQVEAIEAERTVGHLVLLERCTATARGGPRAGGHLRAARTPAFARLWGHDPRFGAVLDHAARFARTNVPVLLLAETGTGKELLARAIHAESPRKDQPMVTVNCGALAPELMASELFGYVGGAFTGALRQGSPGLLAHADGGTLFLDEVAEMPASLQVMLLRVLEDGTYGRVGEARTRRTNVRLVCATCRDLGELVRRGAFRQDLYYRIRGATLCLPALRERSDLLALAEAFVAEIARQQDREPPELSEEVRAWMRRHPWPGNIRELRATLEHATVLAGERIEPSDLPLDVLEPAGRAAAAMPTAVPTPETTPHASVRPEPITRDQADVAVIRRALDDAGGNLSEAARRLGVARSTLYRLLARHGLR